mgnify:CR=1 FL=1
MRHKKLTETSREGTLAAAAAPEGDLKKSGGEMEQGMSMGKILVADDDQNIAELLKLYLEKEGYTVVLAADGMEANEKFAAENPDIVLLDIMMPKLDGWQVCRDIRKKSNCPIIMITAKGETFDKVLGLELGADDYIVKPFEAKEVVARIKAVMRRTGKSSSANDIKEVSYDKLVVNMTKYELKVDGKVGANTWNVLYTRYTAKHGLKVPYPGIVLHTGSSGGIGPSHLSTVRLHFSMCRPAVKVRFRA